MHVYIWMKENSPPRRASSSTTTRAESRESFPNVQDAGWVLLIFMSPLIFHLSALSFLIHIRSPHILTVNCCVWKQWGSNSLGDVQTKHSMMLAVGWDEIAPSIHLFGAGVHIGLNPGDLKWLNHERDGKRLKRAGRYIRCSWSHVKKGGKEYCHGHANPPGTTAILSQHTWEDGK